MLLRGGEIGNRSQSLSPTPSLPTSSQPVDRFPQTVPFTSNLSRIPPTSHLPGSLLLYSKALFMEYVIAPFASPGSCPPRTSFKPETTVSEILLPSLSPPSRFSLFVLQISLHDRHQLFSVFKLKCYQFWTFKQSRNRFVQTPSPERTHWLCNLFIYFNLIKNLILSISSFEVAIYISFQNKNDGRGGGWPDDLDPKTTRQSEQRNGRHQQLRDEARACQKTILVSCSVLKISISLSLSLSPHLRKNWIFCNRLQIWLICSETQLIFNKEISGIPKKLAKHITKARPFFDLKAREPDLRRCAQQAAAQFERQKTVVEMSREQLTLLHNSLNNNEETDAEKKYLDVIEQQLDLVNEAEAQCANAERMHAARIRDLLQLETALRKALQDDGFVILIWIITKICIRRPSIKKARPYYERKEVLTRTLNSQIELMSILEHEVGLEATERLCKCWNLQVQNRKDSYSDSMRELEKISEQIHQERSSQNSLRPAVSDTSSDAESDLLWRNLPRPCIDL